MPFSLLHFNCAIIGKKFLELSLFLEGFNILFDVFKLTVIWYNDCGEGDKLEVYNIFNLNLSDKQERGGCIHVETFFDLTVTSDFTTVGALASRS